MTANTSATRQVCTLCTLPSPNFLYRDYSHQPLGATLPTHAYTAYTLLGGCDNSRRRRAGAHRLGSSPGRRPGARRGGALQVSGVGPTAWKSPGSSVPAGFITRPAHVCAVAHVRRSRRSSRVQFPAGRPANLPCATRHYPDPIHTHEHPTRPLAGTIDVTKPHDNMTNDTNAPVTDNGAGPGTQEYRTYDEMLSTLDALLDEAMRKVESGRVYDAENERVRIKWIRVACQVVDTHRKVQADRDLEELSERVDRLEAGEEVSLKEIVGGDGT